MKFLMLFACLLAFICSSFALTCPANFKEVGGVCGVQRTIGAECPANTKFDINKNLCVLK